MPPELRSSTRAIALGEQRVGVGWAAVEVARETADLAKKATKAAKKTAAKKAAATKAAAAEADESAEEETE